MAMDKTVRDSTRLAYVFTTGFLPWHFQRGQNDFLRQNGFELHLIAAPDEYLEKTCRRDRMSAHPVDIPRAPAPWRDLKALQRIAAVFREIRPDIVHAGTPKGALLGLLAARIAGIPTRFFACHGTITARRRSPGHLFYRCMEGLCARLAHRVWCVSPSLLSYMESQDMIPPGRGVVFGHGSANGISPAWLDDPALSVPERLAELEREKASGDFPVIGFVGRLCRQKGVEVLARAWPDIRRRFPRARLLLAGRWEQQDAVSGDVRRLLEGDAAVIVLGMMEQGVLGRCYRLMDVQVMPSLGAEGFGNVALEGALFGVPVVATRIVGSVDAVLDGTTGTVIPSGDAGALAEAVVYYFENPEQAAKRGLAARERAARDFRPEAVWRPMLEEYRCLLQREM